MKSVVGIDGCKGGWLAIRHSENGALDANIISSLTEIDPLPNVITIDIPIGLTNAGSRACDQVARKFIGSRASSVFPAPIRPVLEADNYSDANELSKKIQGKGMSKQSFAIVPKIREIDLELQRSTDLKAITYEVHPEVSFRAWHGEDLDHAKKCKAGLELRLVLIEQFFGQSAFKYVRDLYLKKDVVDDDIVDAFAALWSAWRLIKGVAETLPNPPETDSVGQRMGIWY